MSFSFRLISPDRTLVDQQVESVRLPTELGEVGILAHHALLTTVLKPGIVVVQTAKGEEEIAVSGGFAEVTKEGLTALVDTAERGEELDMSVIEEAKARAEEVMRSTARQDDVSFAMAAAALERELARLKLAVKYRRRR